MQLHLWPDERARLLRDIHERLLARFGQPGPWFSPDPVSQLVLGLIGGRTYEAVSLAAYRALVLKFWSWEAMRDGAAKDVQAAIDRVTFAQVKAVRLQNALQTVTALRGRLELDFLRRRDVGSAMAWLMRLPGVGPKVAAVTLNFSTLRMPALVIDTHHMRVLRRLRLVRPAASPLQTYHSATALLPDGWGTDDFDDHHQLMKQLGQTICRYGRPFCTGCPLRDLCPAV